MQRLPFLIHKSVENRLISILVSRLLLLPHVVTECYVRYMFQVVNEVVRLQYLIFL